MADGEGAQSVTAPTPTKAPLIQGIHPITNLEALMKPYLPRSVLFALHYFENRYGMEFTSD